MIKKKILIVVGTRPNFIKITQFKKEAVAFPSLDIKIAHTGQHFDSSMAEVFFSQFNTFPDYFLEADNTGVVKQFANIMVKLEELFDNVYLPDLLIVVGDVNSTLAAALTANKKGIRIAHLESGLRSRDFDMPEEINRILTDSISDYFFITEKSGFENLQESGLNGRKFLVGNTMIDTLVAFEDDIRRSKILDKLKLERENFALVTIHRPSNVDNEPQLLKIIELLEYISQQRQVVFPIHPRTKKKLIDFGYFNKFVDNDRITLTEPLDYFAFQKLILECKYIVTDSGGIQEESTYRMKPCLTLRSNTERPITIDVGSNELVEFNISSLGVTINNIESGNFKKGRIPEMWDGKATQRIVRILSDEEI